MVPGGNKATRLSSVNHIKKIIHHHHHHSWFLRLKVFALQLQNVYSLNAIQFSKQTIKISDYDILLINQSRKTLLFHKKLPWVKKDGSEDFDVPMECFHGEEVRELVGTFILN